MKFGTRLVDRVWEEPLRFLIEKIMFLIYIAIQQSISCETNKQILDKKNQEIGIQRVGI